MLRIPSTIHKVETTADGGLKLVVLTQELSHEDETEVMRLKKQLGHFVFSVSDVIKEEDIPKEQLEFKNDKSPGQRLRGVLFRLYEQNSMGHKEFESFYRSKMELIIESLKEKLI